MIIIIMIIVTTILMCIHIYIYIYIYVYIATRDALALLRPLGGLATRVPSRTATARLSYYRLVYIYIYIYVLPLYMIITI